MLYHFSAISYAAFKGDGIKGN